MSGPLIPPDEQERVAALQELSILDTPSPIELGLFIEAAMEHYLAAARRLGVGLTMTAPADMSIQAAPKLLGRILRTLLDHALRFAPPDTTITLAAAPSNRNMVRISVRDHGPGIPAEHIQRLFQPFVPANASDSRSENGFALVPVLDSGALVPEVDSRALVPDVDSRALVPEVDSRALAICRRLAAAMGGQLGYEPAEGGGSRLFIDLPG